MNTNSHSRTHGGVRTIWKVEDLWTLSQDLPTEEVDPTTVINLDVDGWFKGQAPTARQVLDHMKRILGTDLSYPVILDQDGSIMDGAHRACKAILEGHPKILVKRFRETPPPSCSEQLAPTHPLKTISDAKKSSSIQSLLRSRSRRTPQN